MRPAGRAWRLPGGSWLVVDPDLPLMSLIPAPARFCSTKTTCATVTCIKDPQPPASAGGLNPGVIVGPIVALLVLISLGLGLWALRKKRVRPGLDRHQPVSDLTPPVCNLSTGSRPASPGGASGEGSAAPDGRARGARPLQLQRRALNNCCWRCDVDREAALCNWRRRSLANIRDPGAAVDHQGLHGLVDQPRPGFGSS